MLETQHQPLTKAASRFLALTAQPPGMVRRMLWADPAGIDCEDIDAGRSPATWCVPAAEMKQEFDLRENDAFEHVVPLAPQAVTILHTVRGLTGNSIYGLPSARSFREPMSENAVGYGHATADS
jgi:integrase